jgi:quercetin dioxygenase-like cupin family protein
MDETYVENLNEILTVGGRRAGVLWTLGQSDDLNANLVRFAPGEGVGRHVNYEVDVLVLGLSGRGEISINGDERTLVAGVVALVPKGASQSIRSDSEDFAYLTVHRRRAPLSIGRRSR